MTKTSGSTRKEIWFGWHDWALGLGFSGGDARIIAMLMLDHWLDHWLDQFNP